MPKKNIILIFAVVVLGVGGFVWTAPKARALTRPCCVIGTNCLESPESTNRCSSEGTGWDADCNSRECRAMAEAEAELAASEEAAEEEAAAAAAAAIEEEDAEEGGASEPETTETPSASSTPSSVELPNPLGTTNFYEILGRIIKVLMGAAGSMALLMFIYGGFHWLTAAGSAERIKKGRDIVLWSVLGIALMFSAYIVSKYIIEMLTRGVAQ